MAELRAEWCWLSFIAVQIITKISAGHEHKHKAPVSRRRSYLYLYQRSTGQLVVLISLGWLAEDFEILVWGGLKRSGDFKLTNCLILGTSRSLKDRAEQSGASCCSEPGNLWQLSDPLSKLGLIKLSNITWSMLFASTIEKPCLGTKQCQNLLTADTPNILCNLWLCREMQHQS